MGRIPAVLLVIGLTACSGNAPTAQKSPEPQKSLPTSPTAATSVAPYSQRAGPLAVLVASGPVDGPYTVQLAGADGRLVASATGRFHSAVTYHNPGPCGMGGGACVEGPAPSALPVVSISNSRVYYLDGNADVRSLGPDGSTALATHLPGSATVSVGFAISPDDRRIAVSVIEYTDSFQAPVKLRMYVEDLVGGGNHVDLFSSTSVTEWPIGWHAGRLLIAVGPPIDSGGPNVYGATSYHLVEIPG